MNLVKLVEMLKTISKDKNLLEANHSSRYSRSAKKTMMPGLYKPDKTKQLAEKDDAEENEDQQKSGRTDTGQKANKIITEPEFNSQVEPTRGPSAKPQIDTK